MIEIDAKNFAFTDHLRKNPKWVQKAVEVNPDVFPQYIENCNSPFIASLRKTQIRKWGIDGLLQWYNLTEDVFKQVEANPKSF